MLRRTGLLTLWLAGGPLTAQTSHNFVLDHIQVEKYLHNCTTGAALPTVFETLPASATATASLTDSCKGASLKLDFTVTAPQSAGKASVDVNLQADFEQALRGGAGVKGTFGFPSAAATFLTIQYPGADLAASASYYPQAGSCVNLRKDGSGSGQWTDSLSAPDCARSKRQLLTKGDGGALYYSSRTETRAQVGAASNVINASMNIVLVYKAAPAGTDKVSMTNVTPQAGKRQDPMV